MPSPLLTTKLHIPPVRPNLVARPRLIEKLNEGLTRPLTLISAPPGFGKTTLVTTWLEQQSQTAAWLSLDERDNDLARFLAYLIAALETVQADVGRRALNRLDTRRVPQLESVMTLLCNDLAVNPRAFVLVLDDYHLIEAQTIHEAITFLLDHLPSPLHLVVATRADPPLPLARLRAHSQLIELRAPDLRFSADEATTFLNQQMGLGLTAEQVAALDARAEGWIAGLQLAALSMQGRQDIAAFVSAFTGSHRFVLDYLAEEVLQRQTPEIQNFLLQTSILDQMNGGLSDAVTGRNDGTQTLARLEKANLFVVPLDDARQWYRYHHLFDDLLQSRLRESRAEQIPELHRRASAWYEQNGFVIEAIDHALAAPDFDRATHLIEQAGLGMLLHGEDATIVEWIARVPDELVRQRPLLSLCHAAALTSAGKIELASAHLAQVDNARLDVQTRGIADLLQTVISFYRTDLPRTIESLQAKLESSRNSSAPLANLQAGFDVIVPAYLTVVIVMLQIAAGLLRDATDACCRGLEMTHAVAADSPWRVVLGFLHVHLADLLYEWNELSAATQHATQGVEICRAWHNEEFESYALVLLSQIKHAQGDPTGASELLEKAALPLREREISMEVQFVHARQVRLLIAQNRVDDAARIVGEFQTDDQTCLNIEQPFAFKAHAVVLARARVLIVQREFERAALSLQVLCERAQADVEIGTLVEASALLALARHGQGDAAQATTALIRALSLAEPQGYVRTFVDLGEPMRIQISEFRLEIGEKSEKERLAKYADKLLAAFPPVAELQPNPESEISDLKSEIINPLSERELAVLRLIAEGLTNQEIAERLVVTLSTVKSHVYNIYGKLGVSSRTQALVRARERKLL
ncbi:MAG: AAA family ATPase [Chloroflexi bacterium]|nr:AAA family ATPase [Chloroflexota bacterium]